MPVRVILHALFPLPGLWLLYLLLRGCVIRLVLCVHLNLDELLSFLLVLAILLQDLDSFSLANEWIIGPSGLEPETLLLSVGLHELLHVILLA